MRRLDGGDPFLGDTLREGIELGLLLLLALNLAVLEGTEVMAALFRPARASARKNKTMHDEKS